MFYFYIFYLSFWTQIFNRLQTKSVTLAFSLDYFVPDVDPSSEMQTSCVLDDSKYAYVIDEQNSDAWINVNLF